MQYNRSFNHEGRRYISDDFSFSKGCIISYRGLHGSSSSLGLINSFFLHKKEKKTIEIISNKFYSIKK